MNRARNGSAQLVVSGQVVDPSNGALVTTFEQEVDDEGLEQFVADLRVKSKRHYAAELPATWREQLLDLGQIDLDGGVFVTGTPRCSSSDCQRLASRSDGSGLCAPCHGAAGERDDERAAEGFWL
jgi:hypothetical protein